MIMSKYTDSKIIKEEILSNLSQLATEFQESNHMNVPSSLYIKQY